MKDTEEKLLTIRNIAVVCASIFWLISFTELFNEHIMRGIGYIFGAAAYFTELLMMTDCFKKFDHKELLMPYCFLPIYILMAISYLKH